MQPVDFQVKNTEESVCSVLDRERVMICEVRQSESYSDWADDYDWN